ncbi:gfo/Idh/MocA family oxidoreductase [Rhodobacteraceae bacterium 2CG4]|uniref:Gfo/Idh/MocA family oxidoreductase n=1 Tax=Halovulum marinum TaxID=2662447 RepID=A0A6L5YX27_9RHOB|nr:Gfo/Idh/MocA family oxidoreductase [Halovulum marinum]MSU88758.1 gfo/Idh/MocA family oxidoreductase [Halovulum marinum]
MSAGAAPSVGDPVRVVVVGAGSVGARHAQAVAAHPRATLAAVVDPSEPLRAAHDAPCFAALDDVDVAAEAAIIATPTGLHAPLGAQAAARGWTVLVEKPIAATLEQADALIAACEAADVPLLVGHHRRTHAVAARARALLATGAIGRVVGVSGMWCVRKPDGYFDVPWRSGDAGSPVLINLVHDLDLLHYLLGPIAEAQPLLSTAIRRGATEDSGAVALRFENGALGTILFTDSAPSPWGFETATGENPAIAAGGDDCYRFVGTAGALGFPSLTLWDGARDWSEPAVRTAAAPVPPTEPLAAQIDHLCDVVRHGAAPLCSGADGRAALELAQDIITRGRF